MACPHCGSWSVKADRSLAGRLVCGRCGRPLGAGASGRSRFSPAPNRPGRSRRRGVRLWLGTLLALSALLAWLADVPTQQPRRSPQSSPPAPPGGLSQPWR